VALPAKIRGGVLPVEITVAQVGWRFHRGGPLLHVSVSIMVAEVGAVIPSQQRSQINQCWARHVGQGGFDSEVRHVGSNRPMLTGWVQPLHKIHPSIE
jgi:hypothetical protein